MSVSNQLYLLLLVSKCDKIATETEFPLSYAMADPDIVGPEAYTIMGTLLKKNNMKLQMQN